MDYEVSDSSGTNDDLPRSHQNKVPRRNRAAGNGRSFVGSNPYTSSLYSDMEAQIHQLEQEAYCAVLRAFKAQSDAITWEKEGLITELRKELRVSDDEHRELLNKVQADDVIRRIRDWRQGGEHQPSRLNNSQSFHDIIPSPVVSGSRKKQKTSQSHGQSLPGLSSGRSMQYTPTAPVGSRHFPKRTFSGNESGELPRNERILGRKVWTRWPEDNNFYEAVISQYNANEIPPEDVRWEAEDLRISYQGTPAESGHGTRKSFSRGGAPPPGAGRGRGMSKYKKDALPSSNSFGTNFSDIELLNTDTLVKEVERVFDAAHPDPYELEKAKKMLKEHEQALVDAIARLADASDGESDGEEPLLTQEGTMDQG